MKKILLSAVALLAALSVQGQGTVNFANFGAGWLTSRFTDATAGGAQLSGSWSVELLAGTASGALTSVTTAVATFTTGFFNAGVVTVPLTGSGFAQVRVWDNQGGTITSYAQASSTANVRFGQSTEFAISGLAAPPSPPVTMANMPGVAVNVIPEPSTIALGLLGALGAFLIRRRK